MIKPNCVTVHLFWFEASKELDAKETRVIFYLLFNKAATLGALLEYGCSETEVNRLVSRRVIIKEGDFYRLSNNDDEMDLAARGKRERKLPKTENEKVNGQAIFLANVKMPDEHRKIIETFFEAVGFDKSKAYSIITSIPDWKTQAKAIHELIGDRYHLIGEAVRILTNKNLTVSSLRSIKATITSLAAKDSSGELKNVTWGINL